MVVRAEWMINLKSISDLGFTGICIGIFYCLLKAFLLLLGKCAGQG